MTAPKTPAAEKRAADNAYAEVGRAIDLIRGACDYGWIRRKLWGGYRITAQAVHGPDPAWRFDCPLDLDGQPSDLAIGVPCMGKAVLVAGGNDMGADPMTWYPVVRSRLQP